MTLLDHSASTNGLEPVYDERFGYLSEKAKYLGSNFRYQLKTRINSKLVDEIQTKFNQDQKVIIRTILIDDDQAHLSKFRIKSNKVAFIYEHLEKIYELLTFLHKYS